MATILFPDDLLDQRGLLRQAHTNRRSTVLLDHFLEQAFAAIRDEIRVLPRAVRAQIPTSNSLFDLSERCHNSKQARLEVSCALLCACQLSHFIGYYEQRANEFPAPTFDSRVVGLGLGQLSAAAVACSRTLVDLVGIAVYTVRLAFRTGAIVHTISQQSQTSHGADGAWSTVVFAESETVQAELAKIQDRLVVPASARVYITTVARDACLISGHPLRLALLKQHSPLLQRARCQDAPLIGLWHAGHLYGSTEVSQILEPFSNALDGIASPCRTSFSTATGKAIQATTPSDLFAHAINDLLRVSVQWPLLEEVLVSATRQDPILSFELSNATRSWLSSPLSEGGERRWVFQDLAGWGSSSTPRRQGDREIATNIAIVGMSCRFPGADNVSALWDLLEKGRDTCKKIPKDRFDVDTHYDPLGKKNNASHTPYGCFIDQPGLFDPRFFNMSPREATETDPMHRLALVTAYEALEMSGFVLNATPSTQQDRVGTFYGQTCDDWREVNAAQNIGTYFIPGGVRAFAPGRISYYFGFRGPSYSIDTACSSSLAAVHIACQSLITGGCDTAVAGGVNILTAPDIFAGLSKGQFLSKTGSCKTWDIAADGYCRADGVGSIILKREEDALADKDNILGVILASGTNHSADAISITHPHAGNQAYLYDSVLHDAGVDPLDVSYVEMHGTGTQAGDTNEMESVTSVFAPVGDVQGRTADRALHVGAVKSNIGHGEAAAGMAALLKVLLMMQYNAIPPHVGIKNELNPKFSDLGLRNVQIPLKKTGWQRQEGKARYAFVNNFSAAGGNTALLLRDPPEANASTGSDPRPVLPFVMSAKSLSSLQKNIRQLVSFLDEGRSEIGFASLSYTMTSRRMHHNYRIGLAASDLDTLRTTFTARLSEGNFTPISSKAPHVAFVFTGQGSFYPSLGRRLFELSALFRSEVSHLNGVAMAQGFPSFLPAIEGSLDEEHDLSALVTQLALVCVQMALVELWASWGVRPSVVTGHSLGEYAALYAAGVLSKDDTIHLVGHRARLLEERCTPNTHQMLAVKASSAEIAGFNRAVAYEVACINAPSETVICGKADAMEKAAYNLRRAGFKCLVMDLPYAFHSQQIEPILAGFEELASSTVFQKPTIPVISSLLAQVVEAEGVFDPEYLLRHAREPVDFMGAVQAAVHIGMLDPKRSVFVELGAHPVCATMIKSSLGSESLAVASLHKAEDPWKTLSKSLCSLYSTGVDIDWSQFHCEYESSHKLLDLPVYSFDNKNYWIEYVNDWCLHKVESRNGIIATEPSQQPSKLSTSSVHRILSENFEGNTCQVIAQSDVSHPVLRKAVMGHRVNGAGLCPSSIYTDMAMTLGDYIYKQLGPSSNDHVKVQCGEMEVVKPLIINDRSDGPQLLQIAVTADLDRRMAHVRYASVDAQGQETIMHATCVITFEDASAWVADWASTAYLIHGRIDTLEERLANYKADRISRGLAYKMFAALVQFDKPYQGMENVILDSQNFEAIARINFQTDEKDGSFFCSPYWIESLAHLSGLILNGSDAVDSKNYVYISHGWKSFRLARALSRTTKYCSYVKMQPAPNNVMIGDVFILEEQTIIGVVGGLKFQRIPRSILNTMLPPDSSARSVPTKALQTVAPVMESDAKVANTRSTRRPLSGRPPVMKNTPQRPSLFDTALDIVSRETELPLSELLDDCLFADLGVDSLLSLQITGKMREELDVEIQSSVFVDRPTIGDFRAYLSQPESEISEPSLTFSSCSSSEVDEDGYDDCESDSSVSLISTVQPKGAQAEPGVHAAVMELFRTTIAEQMGIELEEVAGSNDLLSLGLDSLMTIVILGILREQTALDLPSDLFLQHSSIDAIQHFLGSTFPDLASPEGKSSRPSKKQRFITTPPTPLHQAISILMQGKPNRSSKLLFLIPDGSGSATSYATIPAIDPRLAVYALNSPFMTTPGAFTNGIPGIASLYLQEVRRRQPRGPYHLGGWSAGGVVAYEMTRQLLSEGERVHSLILLDSPCPIQLEPLPTRLHHFFADIGLLGGEGQEIPAWLLPHFEASIKALAGYEPAPIENKALAPKVLAIWARYGVCRYPDDPRPEPSQEEDPRSMKWLLENRTDFGYNGWDALVGKEAMEMTSLEGNHFTLMKEPEQMHKLARMIKRFLM